MEHWLANVTAQQRRVPTVFTSSTDMNVSLTSMITGMLSSAHSRGPLWPWGSRFVFILVCICLCCFLPPCQEEVLCSLFLFCPKRYQCRWRLLIGWNSEGCWLVEFNWLGHSKVEPAADLASLSLSLRLLAWFMTLWNWCSLWLRQRFWSLLYIL